MFQRFTSIYCEYAYARPLWVCCDPPCASAHGRTRFHSLSPPPPKTRRSFPQSPLQSTRDSIVGTQGQGSVHIIYVPEERDTITDYLFFLLFLLVLGTFVAKSFVKFFGIIWKFDKGKQPLSRIWQSPMLYLTLHTYSHDLTLTAPTEPLAVKYSHVPDPTSEYSLMSDPILEPIDQELLEREAEPVSCIPDQPMPVPESLLVQTSDYEVPVHVVNIMEETPQPPPLRVQRVPTPLTAPKPDPRPIHQVFSRGRSGTATTELPLITAEDFQLAGSSHITKHHLERFYPHEPNKAPNPTLQSLATICAREISSLPSLQEETLSQTDGDECITLPNRPPTPVEIQTMMKVAMYRLIILVDDSSSMRQEGRLRVTAVRGALRRITKHISTRFQTEGVTMRFLNYPEHLPQDPRYSPPLSKEDMENITTPERVQEVIQYAEWHGRTNLGAQLEAKILKPMVLWPAKEKRLEKPVLVSIITDGEPDGHHDGAEAFKRVILRCKRHLSKYGYPPTSVAFHITQVGNSPEADSFLNHIAGDPQVGDIVYCTTEHLEHKIPQAEAHYDRRVDLTPFDDFGMWWINEMQVAINPNEVE